MRFFRRADPQHYLPDEQLPSGTQAPAPPAYVTRADFDAALVTIRDQIAGGLGELRGVFGTQPATTPVALPTPALPPIDDVTDDEYEQAFLRGDASVIRKREAANAARLRHELRTEYDAKLGALQAQGTQLFDQLGTEVTQSALHALPYYTLFKSEIDTTLAQIPVAQRTAQMRQAIYSMVVGANLDKVEAYKRELAAREAADRAALDPPARRHAAGQPTNFEAIFGERITAPGSTWQGGGPLWELGHASPDALAAKDGFKDRHEYARYATVVMAVEDCDTCFTPRVKGKCYCNARVQEGA